jgi:hypothetical protein
MKQWSERLTRIRGATGDRPGPSPRHLRVGLHGRRCAPHQRSRHAAAAGAAARPRSARCPRAGRARADAGAARRVRGRLGHVRVHPPFAPRRAVPRVSPAGRQHCCPPDSLRRSRGRGRRIGGVQDGGGARGAGAGAGGRTQRVLGAGRVPCGARCGGCGRSAGRGARFRPAARPALRRRPAALAAPAESRLSCCACLSHPIIRPRRDLGRIVFEFF